ncbi:MAG: magnesium/cobalt transporter CorA [Gammaproteobacteria bacterium]|nr:magnesium/cobalt transporter CorA [Gammaproteobacteria bacterium]
MVRVKLFNPATNDQADGGIELLDQWKDSVEYIVWADFESDDPDLERKFQQEYFGLNSLAIDDAQRERHPPKLEWFEDHYFLLLKGLDAKSRTIDFGTIQIAIFVGARFLVTRHSYQSLSVDRVWNSVGEGEISMSSGTAFLCYRIVRAMVDRYTPIVLGLEQRLDEIEKTITEQPDDRLLEELIGANTRLKKLRRIFTYHKEIMSELAEHEGPPFQPKDKHAFQDAYEHMERLASLSGLFQELTVDLINGYISVSAHRLNQIMKTLTLVAVIFLPLTLMVGIYGMNFELMPELHWEYGYFVVLTAMIVVAAGIIWVFHRKRWL